MQYEKTSLKQRKGGKTNFKILDYKICSYIFKEKRSLFFISHSMLQWKKNESYYNNKNLAICGLGLFLYHSYLNVTIFSYIYGISILGWWNHWQVSFSCVSLLRPFFFLFCFREHGSDVILNVQLFITRGKSRAMLYLVLSFLLIKYELLWNFSHHLTRHNTPTAF